ncbi:maltose alpha-D-glucosyltransferase [Puia dinghuensis]|uniref:maltose alpha-D-glucosyltransferase n=1 Tax=Puia dinghuensis TaxID=1792502 RepID=A0A8J2UCB2_9BACT|nr:maltose alpha-D-glucosyltransferase [Puia dinghuensis]GGA95701.1 trehalose synthase [Puia dinghuensis]
MLNDELHWYKDAIIYELHIKAFCDGDGDGVGDFQGLMQKLDYLQDLGVTAIWLLPFYPSPLKDDGYDIADYYTINPSYGDVSQFRHFLKEAHRRNLKVITELVINHTSDEHVWFQRARKAPKGSKERNFYVWTDNPDQYKDVRIIFQDFENSNWTWDPIAEQYYWHRFYHHQPDLNYDNPVVQEEVFRIIDHWCRVGVDGFRLDAVPYLFEREGTNGENLSETHTFLKLLRRHLDEHFPGRVLLAEANMWPEDSASYFGNGDECHMNYHFPAMPRMFMALQMEDRYPITDIFDQTPEIPEVCQWAIFLRNHDELTLEMVTDEERDYMYKVYARDPKARINLGIRHRLAPLLDNNRRKIELLNSLLFALPGTPVIYYGDEIGMGDNFYLGDRDGVRTPMQWSPDRNAGFSAANPQKLYLPLILDPEYHYESVNVETQRSNTSSLFWFMKRLIAVRKKFKTWGRGSMKFVNTENPKVLTFVRVYEDETLLVVVNLSKFSQAAEVDLLAYKGFVPVDVFSRNRFPVIREDGQYFFTLASYSFQWFVLEKAHPEMDEEKPLPLLVLRQWSGLMEGAAKRQLENTILPRYLVRAKWFIPKERNTYQVVVSGYTLLPVGGKPVFWLLLEIVGDDGMPGMYQLPVWIVGPEAARGLGETFPEALIAQVRSEEGEGVLVDAFFSPEWQMALLQRLAPGHKGHSAASVVFEGSPKVKEYLKGETATASKIHVSDLYNTSIAYGTQFFLKLYRKIDRVVNADQELTHFLSKEAKFPYLPAFFGSIEWRDKKGVIVLGLLQEMIENHGDGYSFFRERITNYIERIMTAGKDAVLPQERLGTLAAPMAFEELSTDLQTLFGAHAAEEAKLIGVRTAEMHLALASATGKDLKPEPFSLYYQRSLFSAMQSLVRETYQNLARNTQSLPKDMQERMERIVAYRPELLATLTKIYAKKLDTLKIRVHGNYHLGQILLTGKDLAINDFRGDPALSYSESRLRRSPLVDLATMIVSIHIVAFEGIMKSQQLHEEDIKRLLPMAGLWAHHVSGWFVRAYKERVREGALLPAKREDFETLLNYFLVQKAIALFNSYLKHDPRWLIIPQAILRSVLRPQPEVVVPNVADVAPKPAGVSGSGG